MNRCPNLAPIIERRCERPEGHAGSCLVQYETTADVEHPSGRSTVQWNAQLLGELRQHYVPGESRLAEDIEGELP